MPRPRQNAQVLYEAPPTSLAQWQLTVLEALRRLRTPEPWWEEAACRGVGVELFFRLNFTGAAKAYCRQCAVIEQCQAAADAHGAQGVWGGQAQRHTRAPLPHLTPQRSPRRRAVPA